MRTPLEPIVELVELALAFPLGAKEQGLAALTRRWGAAPDTIALADRLAEFVGEDALAPEPEPIDELTERRILRYADWLKYGNTEGRELKASQFAYFMAHEVVLAVDVAYRALVTWNSFNEPPLADHVLRDIHLDARAAPAKRWQAS